MAEVTDMSSGSPLSASLRSFRLAVRCVRRNGPGLVILRTKLTRSSRLLANALTRKAFVANSQPETVTAVRNRLITSLETSRRMDLEVEFLACLRGILTSPEGWILAMGYSAPLTRQVEPIEHCLFPGQLRASIHRGPRRRGEVLQ